MDNSKPTPQPTPKPEPPPTPDPDRDATVREAGLLDVLPAPTTVPELEPAHPTADQLWQAHRAALGGHSAVTGAALPEHLADCPAGVQASHYALACYVAARAGASVGAVPVPDLVSPGVAHELRGRMEALAAQHAGERCTCDTISAHDCRGGLPGCDRPTPAPGHEAEEP